MTKTRGDRLFDLFHGAIELAPEERRAYLERECAGDAALLGEVLGLLEGQGRPSIFDQPILGTNPDVAGLLAEIEAGPAMPEFIGTFRVVRLIGEGGMGLVYEAEERGTGRRVAIKVLKEGRGAEAVGLFRHESRALAGLSHPGIAHMYGVHAEPDGDRPYFVMELIAGADIREYAKAKGLDTRARVALIIKVCEAVEYAHGQRVLHCDLTPRNILVTPEGQAKVLDFGVARLVGVDNPGVLGTESSWFGTKGYVSPEQAQGDPRGLDVRTDVYSLGVIAFELISGETRDRLQEEAVRESLGEGGSPGFPPGFSDALRDDLGLVLAHAIQRDREGRYASVAALREDLRRYLAYEPITIRAATALYMMGKFVRRHRALVGVAALILVILSAGLTATSIGFSRALKAEGEQRTLVVSEKEARREAQDQAAVANQRVKTIEQVLSFLDNEVFGGADPNRRFGPNYSVRQMVVDAGGKLEGRFDDPAVQAHLHQILGTLLRKLGENERAEPHVRSAAALFDRALGPDSRRAITAHGSLGSVLDQLHRTADAEAELVSVLERSRRVFGEEDADTMGIAGNLAIFYLRWQRPREGREILEPLAEVQRRVLGEKSDHYLNTLGNLASAMADMNDPEWKAAYRKAFAAYHRSGLGDTYPPRLTLGHRFAGHLEDSGQHAEAEGVIRNVIAMRRRVLPPEHPYLIQSQELLMRTLESQEQFGDAAEALEEVMAARERRGESGMALLRLKGKLAYLKRMNGATSESIGMSAAVLEEAGKLAGPQDPFVVATAIELAMGLSAERRFDEAVATLQRLHSQQGEAAAQQENRTSLIAALVRVYSASGNSQAAQEWGAKLQQGAGR